MKTLIVSLICCLVTVSKVASQCCDFEIADCDWENTGYEFSPTVLPNTTTYPYFTATEPSPYYMWLQDNSATASTGTTFYIPYEGAIISFDIFFNSPIPDSVNYISVFFNNIDGSVGQIYYGNATSTTWQHHEISCDASNYYCCGIGSILPCFGDLQINVYLDPNYRQGLFAVHNIGTCSSAIPTVPPPTPASCCPFEADTCLVGVQQWYWSATYSPTGLIPPYDGNFMWAKEYNAMVTTNAFYSVTPDTNFTFDYYVSSTSGYLSVHFLTLYSNIELTNLQYTGGVWLRKSIQCLSCCGGGTCDGQLSFEVYGSVVTVAAAVDNVGLDGSCWGTANGKSIEFHLQLA